MKFYFWGLQNQEKNYASKSFLSELRGFLSPFFQQTIYNYFDKKTLFIQQAEPPLIAPDHKSVLLPAIDMKLEPIGHLFTFQLSYWSKGGHTVYPYDTVDRNSITFKIDNYPTNQQLIAIQDSWSDVVASFRNTRLIEQTFRFPLQQKTSCLLPDLSLRIKTTVQGEVLEDILGNSMVEWNKQNIQSSSKGRGIIHDLWLEKSLRNEKVIAIDLGSASEGGLLYLLQALDKSDLEISKVVLE